MYLTLKPYHQQIGMNILTLRGQEDEANQANKNDNALHLFVWFGVLLVRYLRQWSDF